MEEVRTITDGINREKAMKKIYRYFFAAIAIASAASCAEQMEDNSALGTQNAPAEFAQMTISASLGEVTKTTYNDQNVLWEGTESITVFSKGSEGNPQEFEMTWCAEDKTEAAFSGLADLNAETYYAVYPHSTANACNADGVLTVNIPTEQTAVAGGFAPGANVSVAAWQKSDLESEGNIIFNNVCTLLSFGFETDADAVLTQSVTVRMKDETGYINIAGDVSVNYDEEGDLNVSKGTASSIVLTAPTGGFVKGQTYYVLVAPVGKIAEMELTYTHTDATTTCTRRNSNIVASLDRSSLVPLDIIPVAYDDLPQNIEVNIDFTGEWPLDPDCKAFETQKKLDVDEYTYSHPYTYQGVQKTLPLPLKLEWRSNAYQYYRGYKHEDGALKHLVYTINDDGTFKAWANGNASVYIILPTIKGRYLDRIDVLIGEYTYQSTMLQFNGLKTGTAVSLGEFSYSGNDNESTLSMELPKTKSKVQYGIDPNEGFEIKVRRGNMPIKKITLKYTKNIPVASN